jgi:hypothetical protein
VAALAFFLAILGLVFVFLIPPVAAVLVLMSIFVAVAGLVRAAAQGNHLAFYLGSRAEDDAAAEEPPTRRDRGDTEGRS